MNNGPHTHSELSEEILQLKVVFFFFFLRKPYYKMAQDNTHFFSTIK